ncbi:unnamed protein product [Ixodes persulcatus]
MEMSLLKDLSIPAADECVYTACYCEENVWKLCELTRATQPELLAQCSVVFVSNRRGAVPIWCQKSGSDSTGLSVWDYHVFFVYRPADGRPCQVYDLDTTLDFPVDFAVYVEHSFHPQTNLNPELAPMFRVVDASQFLDTFASDRSRMRAPDGSWLKPPPRYPCISTPSATDNLDEFVSVDEGVGVGKVYTLRQFVRKLDE